MSVAHLNYHHLPARSSIDAYVKSTFELRMGPQATKCGGHRGGAREKLDYFLTNLVDIALIEQPPTMEGRTMAIITATKPQVMQRLQSQRAQRDRERAALGLAAQEVKEPNVQDLEEELHEKDDDDDEAKAEG